MAANAEQPIIIKKKKGGHAGHHGGAWKVAYADFVTAMMAFFLVMWIVGLSKPTRQAIASYFRDPAGFVKTSHGGGNPWAEGADKQREDGKPAPLIPKDGGDIQALQAQFKTAAEAIEKEMEKSPEFHNLKDSVEVHITEDGLRVELMERKSSLFFDTGSAKLKDRTTHLLQTIAQQLSKLNSPVVLEGHTDSQPLNGANGYSNWELSTDRANAARRSMEAHGLRPGQVLAVRGYADHKLLVPSNPTHFSNRRVSILVPFVSKNQ